jgi:hypothetical protein
MANLFSLNEQPLTISWQAGTFRMQTAITASMLYDLVACPHRVTMDLYADSAKRDQPNPFVKMLWERGSLYEREVIGGLKLPFIDLSGYEGEEKDRTLDAMRRGEPLIYSGRIQAELNRLSSPELMRRSSIELIGLPGEDLSSEERSNAPSDPITA